MTASEAIARVKAVTEDAARRRHEATVDAAICQEQTERLALQRSMKHVAECFGALLEAAGAYRSHAQRRGYVMDPAIDEALRAALDFQKRTHE